MKSIDILMMSKKNSQIQGILEQVGYGTTLNQSFNLDFCIDGSYVFFATQNYGVYMYSIDEYGALTYIANHRQGACIYNGVCIANGYLVCATNLGLVSYSYNSSGLTYVSLSRYSTTSYYKVTYDGSFLYTSCQQYGVLSYSISALGVFP